MAYPKWTFVKLNDIQNWWETTFNSKWLKNNISSENQKRISIHSLNTEQKQRLDEYLKKDIKLWNDITLNK